MYNHGKTRTLIRLMKMLNVNIVIILIGVIKAIAISLPDY